jgi:hypothetical protein
MIMGEFVTEWLWSYGLMVPSVSFPSATNEYYGSQLFEGLQR